MYRESASRREGEAPAEPQIGFNVHSHKRLGRSLALPVGVVSRTEATHRMPRQHLVFVYGTLKRGFCREHFLAGQSFLAEARTLPKYRMYDCGTYPGLKPCPQDGLSILGELWSVDDVCLARLDREEGGDEGLYARSLIELQPPLSESVAGSPVEAYFYRPSVVGFPDCGDRWVG